MKPARVKEIRRSLVMTQEQFAEILKVSLPTVNRWENGKNKPGRLVAEHMEELAAQNPVHPRPGIPIGTFAELVDYWTGRLAIAIGAGSFRKEVSLMLDQVTRDAYQRGQQKLPVIGSPTATRS